MPQEDMYDLVIVGGGPGGMSAAIYAMRAALKAVIIEKTAPGGQMLLSEQRSQWVPGVGVQSSSAIPSATSAMRPSISGRLAKSNARVAIPAFCRVMGNHISAAATGPTAFTSGESAAAIA